MSKRSDELEELRATIDAIDGRLIEALQARAAVVKEIGARKGAQALAPYQPAREANLLRRLIARSADPIDAGAVFGIWREIVAASIRLQGDFSIAVLRSADGDVMPSALQHFGYNHAMTIFTAPSQVLDAIASREATVGVLPHWASDEVTDWWKHLARKDERSPRIVARLPFLKPSAKSLNLPQAFVVAAGDTEESGRDHSLFALDGVPTASRASVITAAERAGLQPLEHRVSSADDDAARLHFLDLDGYITDVDERIRDLAAGWRDTVVTAIRIGGYASPIDDAAE